MCQHRCCIATNGVGIPRSASLEERSWIFSALRCHKEFISEWRQVPVGKLTGADGHAYKPSRFCHHEKASLLRPRLLRMRLLTIFLRIVLSAEDTRLVSCHL